jgi:nucleotide-binding universal stress UspA family protein
MKTIIVATDFSACSINAAEYAVQLAKSINAEIHLFHSYEIPVAAAEVPSAFDFEAMERCANNDMNDLKKRLLSYAEGKVNIGATISIGECIAQLQEVISEVHPYLIVFGSKGAGLTDRLLFGSNTLHAISRLGLPLIVIPDKVQFSEIRKIAVACELKDVLHTIPVDKLNELEQLFHCEWHIVNVGDENKFDPETVFQSGMLQELLLNKKPYYHFLSGEDIDHEITVFADKNAIDIMILFPKRHNLVQKILHKSHSKTVALHSHVPLLFIHQD